MTTFVQLAVSGLAMGFIYCLVAIETTLIWKATGLLNFAHDKMITLGAFFFGGTMMRAFGSNVLVGLIVTTIFMALFGILFATVVINPLRNMPSRIFAMAGAIFFGFVLREAMRLGYGPIPFTVDNFLTGTLHFGEIAISETYIWIVIVSVALLVAQTLFFKYSKVGRAVRCVAEDKECAAVMGINVKMNIALSVAISSVICGWIGILVSPIFTINHNMAATIGMKGYCAGVIGGFGTYGGAICGGLILGVVETLYMLVGDAVYKDLVAFLMMTIFMFFKPTGLLGESSGKRRSAYQVLRSRMRKNPIEEVGK